MWVAAPLLVIVVMALMGVMEWGGVMVSGIIGTGSVLLLILAIYIMQEPYKRFWPNSAIGIGVWLTDKKKTTPTITKHPT